MEKSVHFVALFLYSLALITHNFPHVDAKFKAYCFVPLSTHVTSGQYSFSRQLHCDWLRQILEASDLCFPEVTKYKPKKYILSRIKCHTRQNVRFPPVEGRVVSA